MQTYGPCCHVIIIDYVVVHNTWKVLSAGIDLQNASWEYFDGGNPWHLDLEYLNVCLKCGKHLEPAVCE